MIADLPSPYHRGVVHRSGSNRQRDRHTEDHDGEDDPDDADAVDEEPESAERVA